jgi:hypothetical protein
MSSCSYSNQDDNSRRNHAHYDLKSVVDIAYAAGRATENQQEHPLAFQTSGVCHHPSSTDYGDCGADICVLDWGRTAWKRDETVDRERDARHGINTARMCMPSCIRTGVCQRLALINAPYQLFDEQSLPAQRGDRPYASGTPFSKQRAQENPEWQQRLVLQTTGLTGTAARRQYGPAECVWPACWRYAASAK